MALSGPPTGLDGAVGGMLGQPGGVNLNGYWWRLAVDKGGAPMYRQRPAPFYPAQVSQGDMGEAQVSPDGRLPFSLRDLSAGAGLAQQPLDGDLDRYDRGGDREGEGVDPTLTPTGPVILSGRQQVPPPAGGAQAAGLVGVFWQAQDDAYLSSGRSVYRFDGSNVALRADLGAGAQASNAILSYQGSQAVPHWYQPCGYAGAARYSATGGNDWFPVSGTGGLVNGAINSIVQLDGEAICAVRSPRVGDAMVCTFDDGGPAPTITGVIDPIGDLQIPITRLMVFDGRIVVLKNHEGLFLITEDRRSMEEEVFPEWRGVRIYARGACVWRGLLWIPTSNGLYAVGPGMGLQKVGPSETETSSLAPRAPRGPMTACDGDAYNLYSWRESPDGPSWLYKANVEVGGGSVQDIAWFPWSQQDDKARSRVVAVCRPGPVAMPAGDIADARPPRLVVDRQLQPGTPANPGASTLYTTAYYRLPGMGRDPRTDPHYEYAPAGTLYYTRLTARFPAINKAWYGMTPLVAPLERKLDGVTFTGAQAVEQRWKLDATMPTATDPFGYAQGLPQRSGTGMRDRFDPPLYGRGLDPAIRLTTLDPTTSPQVYSVTIEYDLRPVPIWRHEMTIDVSAGAYSVSGQQGYGDPLSPAVALRTLRAMAGASGQMALADLWAIVYDVSIPVDGVALRASSGGEAGYSGEVPLLVDVVCVEQQQRDAGTWGVVSMYRWGDLKPMTWGQVRQLG